MPNETLILPRPRVRFPVGKDGYTEFVKRFKEKYPYTVYMSDVTGKQGIDSGDRWAALQWAEKNNFNYAWEFTTLYFAKKEDAALFKMGIWMND